LNVALNNAFKPELIDVNPMLRVELPRVEKQDARSLTPGRDPKNPGGLPRRLERSAW
jgi:hypothetical protein